MCELINIYKYIKSCEGAVCNYRQETIKSLNAYILDISTLTEKAIKQKSCITTNMIRNGICVQYYYTY